MNTIFLNDVLHIADDEKQDWTICLNNAIKDEDVYSFSQNEERLMRHISWKRHAHSTVSFRNIYTKYCLQFLRLDKDGKNDHWLFLGAFEVGDVIRYEDEHETYDMRRMDRFDAYVERLIVKFAKKQGPKQAKLDFEKIDDFEVVRILDKKYCSATKPFPGYNNVRLPYTELKNIVINNDDEWRTALKNVNCVYVITDLSNGKVYVGSTYGHDGIWGRWSCYVYSNGTGHNDALEEIRASNPTYPESNFQWSILEVLYTNDCKTQMIVDRENYWKKVLMSREHGYNKN